MRRRLARLAGFMSLPQSKSLKECITMRQLSSLRRFVNFVAPARIFGQSLSSPGVPTPYGDRGELRALPWEGLHVQGVSPVARSGR